MALPDPGQSACAVWQYRIVMVHPDRERRTEWSTDRPMTAARCRDIMLDLPADVPVRLERRSVTFGEPEVLDVV